MPLAFKNGREVKENDPVVGIDWRGGVVRGVAIKGNKAEGQPEFIFQHAVHKTVCPSLSLSHFLHEEDAVVSTDGVPSLTAKPAPATAGAGDGA